MNTQLNEITNEEIENKSFFKSDLFEWIKTIILSFIVAIILTTFVKPTLVIGDSMYGTLHDKDYLLINRMAYKKSIPVKKDIVVFQSTVEGDKVLIKRVIAVEGDKIVIENSKVYVNNILLKENYINQEEPTTVGFVNTVVPKGKIFVMGDNRNHSLDSRFEEVGMVKNSDIIGKVLFRVFPFNKI